MQLHAFGIGFEQFFKLLHKERFRFIEKLLEEIRGQNDLQDLPPQMNQTGLVTNMIEDRFILISVIKYRSVAAVTVGHQSFKVVIFQDSAYVLCAPSRTVVVESYRLWRMIGRGQSDYIVGLALCLGT